MVMSASSLRVVRDNLFATMTETQTHLEHFLEEPDSGTLLQKSVSNLQQIKGILTMIGLTGGEMLAQEMYQLAMEIPAGANEQHNGKLAAINNGLHVLHSYLEQLEANWNEMPELLLPAINLVRVAGDQARLPESYFFSTRLNLQPPAREGAKVVNFRVLLERLRKLYQQALLAVIRNRNAGPALEAMKRIMNQLDAVHPDEKRSNLYWIAAAALESVIDGKLLMTPERKLLFARLDRELKQHAQSEWHITPRGVIKDLMYLVALAASNGPLATQLREMALLPGLPFTDSLLAEEYQRLSGPGSNVLQSLANAIHEELAEIKDTIDQIERGHVRQEALEQLPFILGKLEKTMGMIGMSGASLALKREVNIIRSWKSPQDVPRDALMVLADTVIYVEGVMASQVLGRRHADEVSALSEAEVFARNQLVEAGIVITGEARTTLAATKRAVTDFVDSQGDVEHLRTIPEQLNSVSGGLWFVDEKYAAGLVKQAADYIQSRMLNVGKVPVEKALEKFADALSGIEYYLEGGATLNTEGAIDLLAMAGAELAELGMEPVTGYA